MQFRQTISLLLVSGNSEKHFVYPFLNIGTEGKLDTFISSVGKWWGTDQVKKEQTDIDVVGLNAFQKEAVLGKCKYKNEILDKKVMMNLIEKKGCCRMNIGLCSFCSFLKADFLTGWWRMLRSME